MHRFIGPSLALARATALALALGGCAADRPMAAPPDTGTAHQQVRAAEIAFAATMAARDLTAFGGFIADDAVFMGSGTPLRGRAAVLADWQPLFARPAAPFSWRPEHVEVSADGTVALSEGPVSAPDGTVIARYISTWRRGTDGRWRVAFDKGYDTCRCGTK